ncbi:MAG: PRC-barrel domain-containing protein [Enhydrobacter sp.]|nr:MAG: PRC-barrel domain-containing protein [Enhydrobacter sp.]
MYKHLVLAALLTAGAATAYAQPQQQQATQTAPAERTVSTGDFNASGQMSGNAIIGARVRNDARDTIGTIDDVYVDKDGTIKAAVVSVGGFLGVGAKGVAVKWEDLKFDRDDDSLVVTTRLGKEELQAMPDYNKTERRKPAPPPAAPITNRPAGGG